MPALEQLADGSVQYEVAQNVVWDQRRLAAPAHHETKREKIVGRHSKRAVPPYKQFFNRLLAASNDTDR